jgi:hypothetical protein
MRFKNTLFTFAMVAALSLTSFAQKYDDQKKPPPKPNPPVVTPQPKNPQKPPADNDKKRPH